MRVEQAPVRFERLPGAVPAWIATVDAPQWTDLARSFAAGGRLVALWATDRRRSEAAFIVSAAYRADDGLAWVQLAVPNDRLEYPDLSALFPSAGRMQRAVRDLVGLHAAGAEDTRPWLRHGAWPEDAHPLRDDFDPARSFAAEPERYPFVTVEGDGVHEIPVGPIHAGIIEPGHFRFSIVGEKVLRLEERLGYVHKGIERRFQGFALVDGTRLAGRVSGDSTVAHAWAYAMAAEAASGVTPPARAVWLRALLLERERVANHLGDLGALGNDGGLAFGLAQFSRLREEWQRRSAALTGHRLMMDRIVPGGVAIDPARDELALLHDECAALEAEVRRLRTIYDEHAGLQDRFLATGIVTRDLAARLGVTGLAARASGWPFDLRAQFPVAPYDQLAVRPVTAAAGDVAARVAVRFDEIFESLRLIRAIADGLPDGPVRIEPVIGRPHAFGVGWIEGWRGDVMVALETGPDGTIHRCHCHDPSWQNWPALEHAVIGNIVPDFPLINKSFNLSYSGQDL